MTTGAVIFAQNNGLFDYVKLAVYSATQIKKHLNLPVSLITDNSLHNNDLSVFDNVFYVDETSTQTKKFHDGSLSNRRSEWKNFTRSQVYDLTPYDTTLVIDSDYVINSSVLKPALEKDEDFQIYKSSFDLAGWRKHTEFQRITPYSIPFYWATVFVFKKTLATESLFTLISHIKTNWQYYRLLYSIETTAFRNDFAFSIALHIMNNGSTDEFACPLPGNMTYITDRDLLVSGKDTAMQFLVEKENRLGEYTLVKTSNLDVHVMNKHSLSRFIDGGAGV